MAHQTICAVRLLQKLDVNTTLRDLPFDQVQAVDTLLRQQQITDGIVNGFGARLRWTLADVNRHRVGSLLQVLCRFANACLSGLEVGILRIICNGLVHRGGCHTATLCSLFGQCCRRRSTGSYLT